MSRPALQPIAVSAQGAGELFGLSSRSWWRLNSAGKVPAPFARIGRSVRWDFQELLSWWRAGCPSRTDWERRNAASVS